MTQNGLNIIQALVGIAAIVIAILAMIISMNTENRNQKKFDQQLEREEKLALAKIKPLLSIKTLNYTNHKAIILINHGSGTAVIREISFSKGEKEDQKIITNLFKVPANLKWDTFRVFDANKHFLREGEEVNIIDLSEPGLILQDYTREGALKVLTSIQQQWNGIKISVEYEDVLGNPQETSISTLT